MIIFKTRVWQYLGVSLWVLLNCAPTSTQPHPPPPSSFQPPPSSIHLHSAHFSLHPVFCHILNVIRTKILQLNNILKFRPKNSKLSNLTEYWFIWYLGGVNPNPDLHFWNSDPKTDFWANVSQKNQSCSSYLKIGTHGISRMLVLTPTLVF